jgi:hypothetical protein
MFVVAGEAGQLLLPANSRSIPAEPGTRSAAKKRVGAPRCSRHRVVAELVQRVQHARHRPAGKGRRLATRHRLGQAAPDLGRDTGLRQRQRIQRAAAAGGQQHLRRRDALRGQPGAGHASAGAGKARLWQRLRTVGSSRLGSAAVSSSRVPAGGSSRVLSRALAACAFSASAGCSTATLPRPRAEVL